MRTTVPTSPKYAVWLYELSFALYCSVLFVWAEQSRPFAWPTRYLYFWHPQAVSLSGSDFLRFYLELSLILTAGIFVVLTLINRFPVTRAFLRATGGILAIAGFPLVCLYSENPNSYIVGLELPIAIVCFLLWVYGRWRLSARLTVSLLIIHYAFWSLFGLGDHLGTRPWAPVTYPVLGFAYSLVWAEYYKQSGASASKKADTDQRLGNSG